LLSRPSSSRLWIPLVLTSRLVEDWGSAVRRPGSVLSWLEGEDKTAVLLCDDAAPLLVIDVAGTIRETIAQLYQWGIRTVMLTSRTPKAYKS
jgi:Cd2+/Zn2+-exporting ATPase